MIGSQAARALDKLPSNAVEIEQAIERIPGLQQAGGQLASTIHSAVLAGGSLTRAIADALHGSSWFGHPLHPALTDIPIGAWTLSALFDLSAALGGGPAAEKTADALIAIGAAAAVPTALAGLADYSAIRDDAVAIGAAHGLLNTAGLGLYLMSLWARARGRRGLGVALSSVALATVGASAGLGGDMVYRRRIGVDNAPEAPAPEQWTVALPLNQLGANQARRVEIEGAPVLIYNDGQSLYAIGAVCSHAGGPLEEGKFEGHCVECPWHQSVFDLRNGDVVHGPATQRQQNYAVRVRNEQVEVRGAPAGQEQQAKIPASRPAQDQLSQRAIGE